MKRQRFTQEQIIGVLREQEAGAKATDLCRRHGISDATFSSWKARFGGMDVSDAKRLKALEDENARVKKLLAKQMLDAAALRELQSKKCQGPPESSLRRLRKLVCQREAVAHLQARMGLSERRALTPRPRAGAWRANSGQEARQARYDRLGSRHRVHLERDPCLGEGCQRRVARH